MVHTGSIVVGGEALVDLVRGGERATLAAHPGGGAFNTARTLARLGCPVRYLGVLSTDAFGVDLTERLAQDGVSVDPALCSTLPTTLAVADVDAEGGATYRFYTQGTSAPELALDAARTSMPADVAMVHVGTLGLVLEPLAATLRAVVKGVADHVLTMVDINCRPAAIADRDAYRDGLGPILAHTHVVKASVEDLAWLAPAAPAVAAARALLDHGPGLVLITDGPRGATAVSSVGELAVAAPAARVADTIGAGDAFGAAFMAWWYRRGLAIGDLTGTALVGQAMAFACLVAARTCERKGACPPTLAELGPTPFATPQR